ncbi:MAG: DNA primase [Lactobacillus sp.]|nr:DNA primase [Lactobacillus sp.]
MPRIPETYINDLLKQVNIVDIISQYVSLSRKGKDYLGLCPFHQEKTPSFTVSPEKQFFKCFGCGKGGNVFSFLMYQDNLSFPEAVVELAKMTGFNLPESVAGTRELRPELKIQDLACKFYQQVLTATKAGEDGRQYAKDRELDGELLDHFRIGFAPNNDRVLYTYLTGQGFSDEQLKNSGLFVETKNGELYDRFRNRLMFPLGDENGHVIAFSGRRITDDKTEAKYVNSPETPLFKKSKNLFHLNEAKRAVKTEEHLILYEGYMDVIAAYKAGVKSGIASMGTSLTKEQVWIIKRITKNVIVNYDGDSAGIHAAQRASEMFSDDVNLGIVLLPNGQDPDEYIKANGAQAYLDALHGALTTTDFALRQLAKQYNLNNDREKLLYSNEAIKIIAAVSSSIEQELYIDRLQKQLNVSKESLKSTLAKERRRLQTAKRRQNSVPTYEAPIPEVEQAVSFHNDKLQDRLLYLFIHEPEARDYLLENSFEFTTGEYQELATAWLDYINKAENPSVNEFINFISDELQSIIVNIELSNHPDTFTFDEINNQIRAIDLRKFDQAIKEQKEQLDLAKAANDAEGIFNSTKNILRLKKEIEKYQKED